MRNVPHWFRDSTVPRQFRDIYQLALVTPGISPLEAISLKHMRHILNFLMYPRRLPHNWHLLYALTLNLGVLFCFAFKHSFAIFSAVSYKL
jgi:hypothetical protein